MSLCSFSQISNAPKKTAAPTPAGKSPSVSQNTLLWEISGKGLKEPSYLYGTMHIVCEEDSKISQALKDVIKKSKQVFFELDMDDMEQMMGVLTYARMNNGLKISDLVTPDEYIRLEEYFKKNRTILPFAMMSRFKPYFVSAIISEGIMNCKKKSSVEQVIMAEAKKDDKNILGLESVEFQASIFDSIPYEKQAKDLVMYIDSIENYRKITMHIVDLYRRQEIHNMDEEIVKTDPGLNQFMDILLYDRNRRWSVQIPEQAYLMSTLFAVGAGHLGGEKGVINLLVQQGFTVKPLKNE